MQIAISMDGERRWLISKLREQMVGELPFRNCSEKMIDPTFG